MAPVPHPCIGRGEAGAACMMQEFRDPAYRARRWQHGENPEHSFEVTELALVRGGLVPVLFETGEVHKCFKAGIDWLTRLHQYEDGR